MKEPDVPRLTLSIEEVAKSLGISHSIAYRLVRDGAIRSIRIGRRLLVPRRALDDYLAACEADTAAPGSVAV